MSKGKTARLETAGLVAPIVRGMDETTLRRRVHTYDRETGEPVREVTVRQLIGGLAEVTALEIEVAGRRAPTVVCEACGKPFDHGKVKGRLPKRCPKSVGGCERRTEYLTRQQRSDRIKNAMGPKLGKELVGGLPYGRRLGPDGKTLEEVPEEVAIVQRARDLRAERLSLRKVSKRLADEGLLSRQGKPFDAMQVSRMIDTEFVSYTPKHGLPQKADPND